MMPEKQQKYYEFLLGKSPQDESSLPVSGLGKGFTLFDVLDANSNPGSPFKKILEGSDSKYGVIKKTETSQAPNGGFTVRQADSDFTVQPGVTPRNSSYYCVSDFSTLARYIFEDSHKALDFRKIPEFLRLGPEPRTEQEKAIQQYLKALHLGAVEQQFAQSNSEYFDLLLAAAHAGHFKSRDQLISHWLFKKIHVNLPQKTVVKWLDEFIDTNYEVSQHIERNLYWANAEGVFKYPRMNDLQYMQNQYTMPVWNVKTSSLDMIAVPKPKILEFYNKIIAFMGEAFVTSLNPNKETPCTPHAFLFHLTGTFSIWVHFDDVTDKIRVVGKSPLGNIFDKTLSIRKRKQLESFLSGIEYLINFQFSDYDLKIGSEKLFAFAK